jgi:quercetin dioxygenase-like cupin family protein
VKSPFHWKSALLFAASISPLASGVSADIALAIGSQSSSEPTLALAPVRQDRPVRNRQLVSLASDVPAETPRGNKASVTPISVQRTVEDLHNPTLSTFLVTFAPGGSVMLHGAPSRGYVLVHVLSGAVTAWAWHAGMGTYRSGQTWSQPAFAYDISTRNASAHEPAEALVLLITEDAK